MKKINFIKKIYYSITCKKYKEMIEEKSVTAILYLAIFELTFTFVISILVAKNFMTASFKEIYDYANNFLVDFIDNSLTLTFDTILILSVSGYMYFLISKNKVKYSKMFCLATYASTLAMIIKYIIFIINYSTNISIEYFKYIYIIITIIYFIINLKGIMPKETKKEEKQNGV